MLDVKVRVPFKTYIHTYISIEMAEQTVDVLQSIRVMNV